MANFDQRLGKFSTTARLFKLINDLPYEQQIGLLRRMPKAGLKNILFKTVIDLSPEDQKALLEQLETASPERDVYEQRRSEDIQDEMSVRTVSLDEDLLMRENPRKPCYVPVQFTSKGQSYSDHVLDISAVGVFIGTQERLIPKQDLLMTFSLPNSPKPLRIAGEVVWSGAQGVGIKFKDLWEAQRKIVKEYVESAD